MRVLPFLHPRATLDAAAATPSVRRGATVVVATGVLIAALGVAGTAAGNGGAAGVVFSLLSPVLLVAFWLVSGLLVGAGARLVGWAPQRETLLAVSGLTYWVLTVYALFGLLQSLSPHLGGDAVGTAMGWLALPVVGWFVALNAVAAVAVYRGSPMAAVAIALLPYAVLSAALLFAIVILSGLHAAGVA